MAAISDSLQTRLRSLDTRQTDSRNSLKWSYDCRSSSTCLGKTYMLIEGEEVGSVVYCVTSCQ